jgi:hypothetical protein
MVLDLFETRIIKSIETKRCPIIKLTLEEYLINSKKLIGVYKNKNFFIMVFILIYSGKGQ